LLPEVSLMPARRAAVRTPCVRTMFHVERCTCIFVTMVVYVHYEEEAKGRCTKTVQTGKNGARKNGARKNGAGKNGKDTGDWTVARVRRPRRTGGYGFTVAGIL